MGLAHVHKPEGLVSREVRSKARSENTIRKCDSNRRDSQMQSTGATHKCDQQMRLTSAIDRCVSQVRLTGATHKCDQLNRESKSLQVCKFASLKKARKFASLQVCAQKTQKIQKTLLNESGQFDNECSTINWCLRVDGTLRLLI